MAKGKNKTPMTPKAASRIQSSEAKANGGKVKSGGFASRAQSKAAQNLNSEKA